MIWVEHKNGIGLLLDVSVNWFAIASFFGKNVRKIISLSDKLSKKLF